MKKWLRKLFHPNREYFEAVDWGTVDNNVLVEGYKDQDGVIYVTKVKVLEESK